MTEQNRNNTNQVNRTNGSAQNGTSLRWEIVELNKNLKLLTNANRKRNVIMRGLMNGVFTAIGASLGFALFLTGFANFLKTAENFPLIDRIVEKTHLDTIIQRYLEDIEKPTPVPTMVPTNTPVPPTATPIPTNTPTPVVEVSPTETSSGFGL